ncbi:hypothetical protein BS11774_05780 [Bacillus subtilis]|nr:hypothetical protein BSn5_11620 [Bacillus subtilis BSn5]AMR48669.1 hypothetical protein KHRBS_21600 [Bacillus subtilis subsp. subtilis]ASZ59747.1 hypothetical protein CLD04_00090 [Bacillus subtilis]UQZ66610.1 hypothetical protein C2H97_09040 [Bacillus subtilis PY79]AWM23049.1 hypothetical protein DJ572_20860 [Bacillus subtilis]
MVRIGERCCLNPSLSEMLKQVGIYGITVMFESGKRVFDLFSIRVATRELSSLYGDEGSFYFRQINKKRSVSHA